MYFIDKQIYNLQNNECSPQVLNYSQSQDNGKTWTQKLLPNGKNASLINIDKGKNIEYYVEANTSNNRKYLFSNKNNAWDSIEFVDTGFSFLSINNGKGIMLVASIATTPLKFYYAISSNGGKGFQLLQNIDYSKTPLNNQSLLKNLVVINDSFWIINYSNNDLSINGVYISTDFGSSWKSVLNENIGNIIKADSNTAYINSIPFSSNIKGNLYQVSEKGNKLCLTTFHARIHNMNFFDASRGLILTIDTPNSQPGIWRMKNGGGTPCYIQNTGIKNHERVYNSFTIFPNPAIAQIIVSNYSLPVHSNYQIYNLLGTLVQQGNLEEKETTININPLAEGLYFIRVGGTTLKFVKGKD